MYILLLCNDKVKPWYDSTIRRTFRHRHRLKKKAIQTYYISDWNAYKRIRNKVNNQKKQVKERFYNTCYLQIHLEDSTSTNPKFYWKTVKHWLRTIKITQIKLYQITEDNGIKQFYCTDAEKANCLNNYFASISNIHESDTSLPLFTPKTDIT